MDQFQKYIQENDLKARRPVSTPRPALAPCCSPVSSSTRQQRLLEPGAGSGSTASAARHGLPCAQLEPPSHILAFPTEEQP